MIGDIFVGALLILSGCINLLAIGAFWVTPSLRTTANRFVINLLLANFISCLILSPFAFNVKATSSFNNKYIATNVSGKVDNNSFVVNSTTVECSNKTRECLEISIKLVNSLTNQSLSDIVAIDNDENANNVQRIENILMKKYQSWSLDLVVALSVLSVLLVVMDTFIAVTDPLRYHSRISDLKAWLLIAFCWVFSLSFGVASALRTHDGDLVLSSDFENFIDRNVYNIFYLVIYFLSIVILPFLLVILMYWRIYSEARESGQRMRQNGSSPLLQSAINLAATAAAHQQQSTILTSPAHCLLLVTSSSPHGSNSKHQMRTMSKHQATNDNGGAFFQHQPTNDGLTMKIDKQDYNTNVNNNITSQQINFNNNNISHLSCVSNSAFSDTRTFLLSSPPNELTPMLTTVDEKASSTSSMMTSKSQQHQNILLTLTTACDPSMKRNQSAKHLLLTEENLMNNNDDNNDNDFQSTNLELRQVRSTPNFQKSAESYSEMSHHRQQRQEQTSLELPSIQASPKALRYMTSLRHRLSNASSLFKYREEGRAARISILVVIMFLLTYFPYGLLSLIHGQDSIIKESNITLLSVLFVLLANLCSPFIFAYRNKRVRRGVRRLLGIDKKTNERLEKLNSLKRSCSMRIKNYRQNNLHKSFNLGFKSNNGIKASNIRRTQSFVTCKYLTPPDAVKIAALSSSYETEKCHHSIANKHHHDTTTVKEKKSILKFVCDSSKKIGCQFTNCQMGQSETTTVTLPVEV